MVETIKEAGWTFERLPNDYRRANNIMDMAGLDEKFSSMIGEQMDIRDKLKPIERRLATLKKHIEQADLYMRYKGKKALSDTE